MSIHSSTRISEATANGLYTNGSSGTNGHGSAGPISPRGAGSPRGDDVSLKDLVDLVSQAVLIIRAKWYWGLLTAVIVGGLAGSVLLRRPIESSAQTLLLAQNSLDKVIGSPGDMAGGDSQTRENSLRNHLSVMNSRKFQVRLAQSFSPEERALIVTPYLKPGQEVSEELLEGLLAAKVNVERERGREFFTITVNHLNPDTALLIADRLTQQYMGLVQSEFRDANKMGLDLLVKQSETLRQQIAQVEEERLEFRKQNKIISRVDNQGILSARLQRLDSSLTDVRIKVLQLGTQAAQAKADRKATLYPWNNAYLATYANNPQLRQDLDKLSAQRSVLASRYGPNHPKLRDMDASITGTQESILRNFDLAVLDLQAQFDAAEQTRRQLQEEFDNAFTESIEIEKLASRYEIIGTDVESLHLMLAQLQKKIGETTLFSQLPTDFMQVVDPAFIVKPRVPKKFLYIILTALLSFGAFVSTPLLVNLLDERIKGTTDLESVLGKPLLGAIPFLRMRPEDRSHVVRDRTDLGTSEAFVSISAQLDLISVRSYPKCILVTSTLPGEGKSTVASNLAAAYTQLGRRAVVLDLDLRRPVQHVLHGIDAKAGFLVWAKAGFPLENLLAKDSPLGLCVLPDGTHLIPAGGDDPQPSHHLISKNLTILIQELKNNFDIVIIDTPPAGLFQDAAVVSRQADERILVARDSRAPVAQVQRVIYDFDKANAPFTGTVVNGFNPSAAHRKLTYGYHKKNYGYHVVKKQKKGILTKS